jgi:hypothetical protein
MQNYFLALLRTEKIRAVVGKFQQARKSSLLARKSSLLARKSSLLARKSSLLGKESNHFGK